jgi:hypothetical protein
MCFLPHGGTTQRFAVLHVWSIHQARGSIVGDDDRCFYGDTFTHPQNEKRRSLLPIGLVERHGNCRKNVPLLLI